MAHASRLCVHGANALNCAAYMQASWTRSTTSRAALLRTAATALALSSAHSWAPLHSPSLSVRTNSYTAQLLTNLPFPYLNKNAESSPAVHESVNIILTCCSESAHAPSLTWHKLFHACLMPPVSWCTCAALVQSACAADKQESICSWLGREHHEHLPHSFWPRLAGAGINTEHRAHG